MRLIRASSVELEEFQPGSVPKYAILSHRWGKPETEVQFHDIGTQSAKSKHAYQKVLMACHRAQADGYKYIWIDTCCIDKSSSAELTEAINSMFQWYQNSAVCYAFLSDVSGHNGRVRHAAGLGIEGLIRRQFISSSWFTRGWTLQELLAPSNVIFFDDQWRDIGTKHQLRDEIFRATGIGLGYLEGWAPISFASIAQRMSWMAKRKTTRPEDTAYCLLGIFSVNMPLLYGEGERAFIRLQDEIMKNSYDHSIFAWINENSAWMEPQGILASSPRYFRDTGTIAPSFTSNEPYSMTNRGLRLSLHLQREFTAAGNPGPELCIAALNCVDARWPAGAEKLITIVLAQTQSTVNDFVRVNASTLRSLPSWSASTTKMIYLQTQLNMPKRLLIPINKQFVRLKTFPHRERFNLVYSTTSQNGRFQPLFENTIIEIPQSYGRAACAMLFEHKSLIIANSCNTVKYVLIAIGSNFPPHLRIGPRPSSTIANDLLNIAFDAHYIDDIPEGDILQIASKLYIPYTIGMELFVDRFAISVRQATMHPEVYHEFDPTVPQISIRIRELTSTSHRPINGAKWQHPAVRITIKTQELGG